MSWETTIANWRAATNRMTGSAPSEPANRSANPNEIHSDQSKEGATGSVATAGRSII